mmetsp:Transcript_99291/g.194981  ORF Transcript_99291/g.194981 Transcript_99291/m.194981 type:complete len:454 (-) Transcript_99291:318-1679(-)|eukprot:CAMPEP_0170390320 /NCGR_PEP_ID=MMETSP0117_2-20130122/19083_1 /TAXON_ID=400756 /ORGANISM="Durinskia baltica, Strain CSIRO CS-38" /LENGTH=453 /DNA_ID=CAMNT_0010646357 /DNA_START=39 /DNA_END=1400 /DNA_ORIENTATION=+
MSDKIEETRKKAAEIIANAKNLSNGEVAAQYNANLEEFLAAGGSRSDMIVRIGEQMFDFFMAGGLNDRSTQGPHEDEPIEGSMRLDFDYLEKFMVDAFEAVGVPAHEARVSANVLIEADKRGIDSHGIGRLKPIYFDRIKNGILHPYKPIEIIKETSTTALVDGQLGLGLYVGPYCMDLAIKKAKEHGVGFVVAKNSTHYGIAGYYATMATDAGCIGFTGTNARPSIAPTFGVEPCLGTNPLCFGIPTDEEFPFVIDCATSINQRGKIEKYERLGMDTPKGMVIDTEGKERTDTKQILIDMVKAKCALCPMGGAGDALGGYKGYSWATVVELLSTAFQSGPFGAAISGVDRETGKPAPMPLGNYFLAIDIEALCDVEVFKKNAGELLRFIRGSAKDPRGPQRIWTAGEFEHDTRKKRHSEGGVVVPPVLLRDMQALRDYLPGMKEKYEKLCFE